MTPELKDVYSITEFIWNIAGTRIQVSPDPSPFSFMKILKSKMACLVFYAVLYVRPAQYKVSIIPP